MDIPDVGEFELDDDMGWHFGPEARPAILRGAECQIILDGYEGDADLHDFRAAIMTFLASPFAAMEAAQEYVYRYYQDMKKYAGDDPEFPVIDTPAGVWKHVHFGSEVMVQRGHREPAVYVSLECNCDWEVEHGLQIVLRHGNEVCKVGPFDGHLTNEDAYADPSLKDVIYRSL